MASDLWISLLFLLVISQPGACKDIATGNFSQVGNVTPLQWGQRSYSTSCALSFSGTTVQPSAAYIHMRFDVRVLNFTHYLAYLPDSVTIGDSLKWQIVRSDYSYTNSLHFTFSYIYSDFLGAAHPQGICTLYNNYTEALSVANSTSDLDTPVVSRLVDTSPFSINIVTSSNSDWDAIFTSCVLNPPTYIGLYEAYTRVVFDAAVYNITSTYSTEFISTDPDLKWYFGRHPAHGGYYDEGYTFTVPSGSTQHSTGTCELYAISNETLPGIISTFETVSTTTLTSTAGTLGTVTTTTATAATTPDTLVPVTTATATAATTTGLWTTGSTTAFPLTTVTTATMTSNLTTTLPVDTYEIVANFTHSGNRRFMQETPGMRDQIVLGGAEIWSVSGSNPLACGRRCLEDPDCISVFFVAETKFCHAHNVTYSKGDGVSRYTSYYVIV